MKLFATLSVLTILATGCSSTDATTATGDWALSVAASSTQTTMLVGDQLTLHLDEIRDGVRRTVSNETVAWRVVSGPVSVGAAGLVSAYAPGTAIIEARRTDEQVTFSVSVSIRPVVEISLQSVSGILVNDTVAVSIVGTNDRGGQSTVTDADLTSRAPGIVNVLSDGRLVGVSAGTAVIIATRGTLRDSISVTVSTSPVVNPSGGYVEIQFVGAMSAPIQAAFIAARDRLNQIFLESNFDPILVSMPAGTCGTGSPAVNATVRGVQIAAQVTTIDGVGSILGQAGPCIIRSSSTHLPIVGMMRFDEADLNAMVSNGSIQSVVLHEMLHVVGIGTIWSYSSFAVGLGGLDPRWTGPLSSAQYLQIGGSGVTGIPVENTGGSGTKDSHWRETTFGNELMTGWINGSIAPLSRMTIQSLADQGYHVSIAAADSYSLPAAFAAGMAGVSVGQNIQAAEMLEVPLFVTTPIGTVTRIGGVPDWRSP